MTTRPARSPRFPAITSLEQLAHAYPELVRRVLRYLRARCDADHAAAEDAAHDAIEDIARRVRRGETVRHPLTFACARARNALRNEQRAATRVADRLTTGRPYGRLRVERHARVDDEQRQALRETLTPIEYEALELRLRGLTVEQAAASLGIPHSTYTSRLQRANARLRRLTRTR
jgi:RNA polymerase sigma factor (sigma-70 family)